MAIQPFAQKPVIQDRASLGKKFNKTRLNVYLDLLLTGMFVIEMEEHFSGLPLHEVLGVLFAVAFSLHIILHWDWVVSITRTFFSKLLHESRFNYLLNVALFVDMAFVTVSGILISRTLGLNITLGEEFGRTLQMLHMVGSELVLIIVALHVAMHWKWINTNAGKYLFGWVARIRGNRETRAQQDAIEV
ncbi:MAG: DUF4405 domain-containing protein [Anaerolineae bacterium]|nr:DUF4405 domain-containing protein [Anaerolineae bacterium]